MRVSDLIAQLSQLDPDMEVVHEITEPVEGMVYTTPLSELITDEVTIEDSRFGMVQHHIPEHIPAGTETRQVILLSLPGN